MGNLFPNYKDFFVVCWRNLAKSRNPTVMEICDDMIRVSHGFKDCQMIRFIADRVTSSMKTERDDILNFYGL